MSGVQGLKCKAPICLPGTEFQVNHVKDVSADCPMFKCHVKKENENLWQVFSAWLLHILVITIIKTMVMLSISQRAQRKGAVIC